MSTSFSTRYEKYGATGAVLISVFLCHNKHLQVRDISGNNISDNGAIAISECLKSNNAVQKLSTSPNENMTNITITQKFNTALQVLDILSNNNISDVGAVAISECLVNNNILQELNMSRNQVSDKGITYLVKLYKIMHHLMYLIYQIITYQILGCKTLVTI